MHRVALVLCAVALLVSSSNAVHGQDRKTPEQRKALYDAHRGDFDYLLGDWQFSGMNKEFGSFNGYWSAVRLAEGQILDEYRVVGDKGETFYVTTTLRNYNVEQDRWDLVGMGQGDGLQETGTGRRVGNEVHIEQRFEVSSEQPFTLRIRYSDIIADRFSWAADRSNDGGKTWIPRFMTIEARRIAPPRSMGPLAPARNAAAQGRR